MTCDVCLSIDGVMLNVYICLSVAYWFQLETLLWKAMQQQDPGCFSLIVSQWLGIVFHFPCAVEQAAAPYLSCWKFIFIIAPWGFV